MIENIAYVLAMAGAAILGWYTIWKFIVSVYGFVKRLELIHKTILLELLPNGGNSIKDQISKFDTRLTKIESVIGIADNTVTDP